jgi:hypothetical protein
MSVAFSNNAECAKQVEERATSACGPASCQALCLLGRQATDCSNGIGSPRCATPLDVQDNVRRGHATHRGVRLRPPARKWLGLIERGRRTHPAPRNNLFYWLVAPRVDYIYYQAIHLDAVARIIVRV